MANQYQNWICEAHAISLQKFPKSEHVWKRKTICQNRIHLSLAAAKFRWIGMSADVIIIINPLLLFYSVTIFLMLCRAVSPFVESILFVFWMFAFSFNIWLSLFFFCPTACLPLLFCFVLFVISGARECAAAQRFLNVIVVKSISLFLRMCLNGLLNYFI